MKNQKQKIMYSTLKKSILLLLCCICLVSFTETNKKSATTASVDLMKSDVLVDATIKYSWGLLKKGQELADQGKSVEDIIKTLPEGTLVSTNENAILFFIEGSIPMIIELDTYSNQIVQSKGGGGNTSIASKINDQKSLATLPLTNAVADEDELVDVVGSERGDDERQIKKALIIAPYFNTEFKGKDDAAVAYKYLKENRNYKDNITFRKENITIEDFINLDQYDLVHLSTHGINYCTIKTLKGLDENKVPIFGIEEYTKYNCKLKILTGIYHGYDDISNNVDQGEEFRKKYAKYLDYIIVTTDQIILKPTFFSHFYNKKMDDKIWIFSACELGQSGILTSTIKSIQNNSHFLYWQNTVGANEAQAAFDKFYENLIDNGLDVDRSFDKIPLKLREKLPSEGEYFVDQDTVKYKTTTSLEHLQTGEPRHGIEVIDMLHPKNDQLVQQGDLYELTGDFNDGKDEEITIKVKLIGYTKAEFQEKQMSISLEVDGDVVLSKQAFLPDVSGDNSTVESVTEHEYGVMVTITEIAIPDVGTKEELTLKATLHLNEENVSIHKETVSILSYGIIATTKQRGKKSKYTYDGKRKTGKYEVGSNPVVYNDDKGYSYMHTKGTGWIKVNMRRMTGTNANYDEKTTTIMNYPLVGFALTFKINDIEASNKFKKTKVDCDFPVKCAQYSTKGAKLIFNPNGKLIEYEMPKQTIHYTYGKYDVILPDAVIPEKVQELENVMSRLKIGGQ